MPVSPRRPYPTAYTPAVPLLDFVVSSQQTRGKLPGAPLVLPCPIQPGGYVARPSCYPTQCAPEVTRRAPGVTQLDESAPRPAQVTRRTPAIYPEQRDPDVYLLRRSLPKVLAYLF